MTSFEGKWKKWMRNFISSTAKFPEHTEENDDLRVWYVVLIIIFF